MSLSLIVWTQGLELGGTFSPLAASHRPIVSEDAGERAEPCQGGPNKPHAGLGKRPDH